MSFIEIHGWAIAVENGSPSTTYSYHGELDRRFNNRPSRARRNLPRAWNFGTCFKEEDCADTLEGIVTAQGHHFSFESDIWSDLGLPTVGSWFLVNAPAFRGSQNLKVDESVTWNAELQDDKWTVILWRLETAVWHHYAIRSDGAKWKDGVRNDATATTWLAIVDGSVVITEPGLQDYDEVTIYRFNACDQYIEDAHAWVVANTETMGVKAVKAEGDFSGGVRVACVTMANGQSYVQVGSSTGWKNNERKVTFTLEEEQAAFK